MCVVFVVNLLRNTAGNKYKIQIHEKHRKRNLTKRLPSGHCTQTAVQFSVDLSIDLRRLQHVEAAGQACKRQEKTFALIFTYILNVYFV